MNPERIADIPGEIRKFLNGETDIVTFRELYDTHEEINDFLQAIVDEHKTSGEPMIPVICRRADGTQHGNEAVKYFLAPKSYPGYAYGDTSYVSVRDYLTMEFRLLTTNVRTASGAWEFYQRLFSLFYQYDQTILCRDEQYQKAFDFALDAIPEYLSGGEAEMYIQEHIIPQVPADLPKGKRIKAVKALIREAFKSEKGYPAWIQSSEWPLGKDGKPATYLGKKKLHGGEAAQYSFRDNSDGSIILVEQSY